MKNAHLIGILPLLIVNFAASSFCSHFTKNIHKIALNATHLYKPLLISRARIATITRHRAIGSARTMSTSSTSAIMAKLKNALEKNQYLEKATFSNSKGDTFELQRPQLMKTAKNETSIIIIKRDTGRGMREECTTVKLKCDETDSNRIYSVLKEEVDKLNPDPGSAHFSNITGDEFFLSIRPTEAFIDKYGNADCHVKYGYIERRVDLHNKN